MSGPSYKAHYEPSILGSGGCWFVQMNGSMNVEVCRDQKHAENRAAALSYANSSLPYGKIGLDGTDLHWPRGFRGEVWIGSKA